MLGEPQRFGLGSGGQRRHLVEVLWVALPKVLSGVALLGMNILLLRAWGPEQFGFISVCLTAVVLLDTIIGSAVDMSIFRLAPLARERNIVGARQVEQAGLLLKPLAAIILLPLLGLSSAWLSALIFRQDDQGDLIVLVCLAVLGVLLVRSAQVHFQIERRFSLYGITDLAHSGLRFGPAGLLLAYGLATPESVLIAFASGSLVVALLTLLTAARPVVTAPFSGKAMGELMRVLRWFLATVVVGSLVGRMDVFFVSGLAGVKEAGIYGAAQLFAMLPQLLGLYMAAVFSPRVLPMWRRGELAPMYSKFQSGLIVSAAGGLIMAFFAAGILSSWVLPERYHDAAPVFLALLPAGLCAFVVFPWTVPFLLYTRPKLLLTLDCASLPILVVAYLQVIPLFGIRGAAIVTSVYGVARTALYLYLADRILVADPNGRKWSLQRGFSGSMQLEGSSS